jgi:hypothetical protein
MEGSKQVTWPPCDTVGCKRESTTAFQGRHKCDEHAHELRSVSKFAVDNQWPGRQRLTPSPGMIRPVERTFAMFVDEVRTLIEAKASEKGYNKTGADGDNELFDFCARHFPGQPFGEVVYKLVRYQNKGDETDLFKAAAWLFLIWSRKPR